VSLVQRLIQPLLAPLAIRAAVNQLVQPRIIQRRLREAALMGAGVVETLPQGSKTLAHINTNLLKRESLALDVVKVTDRSGGQLWVYRNAAQEPVAVSSWRRGLLGRERERLLMVANQCRQPTLLERTWFGVHRWQAVEPQWRVRQKASPFNVWSQFRGEAGAPRWGFRALPYDHLTSEMVENAQRIARKANPRPEPEAAA
jgi:hypothetical protein